MHRILGLLSSGGRIVVPPLTAPPLFLPIHPIVVIVIRHSLVLIPCQKTVYTLGTLRFLSTLHMIIPPLNLLLLSSVIAITVPALPLPPSLQFLLSHPGHCCPRC